MRLAEYLYRELPSHGFVPIEEPSYEDWGVYFFLKNEGFPVMIGCGNLDVDEYLVVIDPSKPTIRKGLFRKRTINTTPVVVPLSEAIEAIVRTHPETRDVCWR